MVGRLAAVAASILLSVVFDSAARAQSVTWVHNDLAPLFILEGPDKGKGYYDLALKDFEAALPGLKHGHVQASLSDIMQQFGRLKDACAVGLIRTPEREKLALFTQPILANLPNALIVPAAKAAAFASWRGADGAVDLARLAAESDLVVGKIAKRAYGGAIDAVLKAHEGSSRFLARPGESEIAGLLDLMGRGQIDGVLGYGMEVGFLDRRDRTRRAVALLPIQGTPKLIAAAIACSKTADGEALVAAIDRVIDAALRSKVSAYYADWIDAGSRARYQTLAPAFIASGRVE